MNRPIRFLPFLAACLSLGSLGSFGEIPQLGGSKKEKKMRKARDRVIVSTFGHRWSWNRPHLGPKQAARLERRKERDAHAASLNYPGWCDETKSFSQQP